MPQKTDRLRTIRNGESRAGGDTVLLYQSHESTFQTNNRERARALKRNKTATRFKTGRATMRTCIPCAAKWRPKHILQSDVMTRRAESYTDAIDVNATSSFSYTHLLYGCPNDQTHHREHNSTPPAGVRVFIALAKPFTILVLTQKPLQTTQEAYGRHNTLTKATTLVNPPSTVLECGLNTQRLSIRDDSVGALRTRVPVSASTPLVEPLVQVGNVRVGGVEELEDVGVRQQIRAVS